MIRKLVVAIDGSEHSRKALKFGCEMVSKAEEGRIYLVHVIRRSRVPADIIRYVEEENIKESPRLVYLERVGARIMEGAVKAVDASCAQRLETVILQGDPAEQIVKFAGDNSAEAIITGSKGLSELKATLLGSVARKICRLAPCTCITVK